MSVKCPNCQHENPDDTLYCGKCGGPLKSAEEISITKTLITPTEKLQKGMTVAGRYTIIEELGRGGMGVVYKAEDTKLKRTVALKFLPPELTHISEVKERFMREAQAAAALDHPNICTVHEFDEAEEKTFISMAYIEGQSLKKKIESGPLELDEAIRIALQVAEGLRKAHKSGVVHRDIKSANIMVTEDNQAKIMDFGLARMTGGTLLTQDGTAMGTIAYMSPEQAQGEEVDHRTDIWSFGVVLYEMLSGQLPFKGEHDQAVVYSILNKKIKPLTDLKAEIPISLEQVVSKALEKNPDKRYQHIEELLDDLRSISDGIVPEEIRARVRKARLFSRKRAILYASLAGLTIIIAVIARSLFTRRAEAIDSIAVLPFENVNAEPNIDYLCDGIAETIINKLSQLSGFKTVINRASAFTYKGKTVDPRKIGQELGVKAVLLTRMVRQGDRLTISPTLVRAEDGGQLWGERYERKFEDIQSLEENIATSVVQVLRLKLTEKDKRAIAAREIDSAAAYEYYLKAKQEIERFREDALDRAVQYLQSGLALVGDNALLYSAMAYGYFSYANIGVKQEDYAAKAVEYANKALALDPSFPKALVILGLVEGVFRGNQKESIRYLKKALAVSPNDPAALTWLAVIYSNYLGKIPAAMSLIERAAQVDPLNPLVLNVQATAYFYDGRFDLALKPISKAYQMDPGSLASACGYAMLLIRNRKIGEASSAIDQMVKLSKDNLFTKIALVYKYAFLNDRTNLFTVMTPDFQEVIRVDPGSAYWMAAALALIGEKEKAMDWLENAVNQGFINYPILAERDPWLASIRGEPRFKKLMGG
jgi:serine/threonine protein kinase